MQCNCLIARRRTDAVVSYSGGSSRHSNGPDNQSSSCGLVASSISHRQDIERACIAPCSTGPKETAGTQHVTINGPPPTGLPFTVRFTTNVGHCAGQTANCQVDISEHCATLTARPTPRYNTRIWWRVKTSNRHAIHDALVETFDAHAAARKIAESANVETALENSAYQYTRVGRLAIGWLNYRSHRSLSSHCQLVTWEE